MENLKCIGCRVLAPLFLAGAGILMIVAVPMNANQFLIEVGNEVVGSDKKLKFDLHQTQGLIYMDLTKDADSGEPDDTYNLVETSLSR